MKKPTKKPKKATLDDVISALLKIETLLKAIHEAKIGTYTINVPSSPSNVWTGRNITWKDSAL
jgi:hypothetical protein